MKLDEINYQNWFLKYVDKYGTEPEIIMKKEHSLRVANDMKNLFKQLNKGEDYTSLAHFIGLFHDIGRFEQWKQYHTFYDASSVDHACFSAENLIFKGLIEDIIPFRDYDLFIYHAIKYHNKYGLPKNLNIKDEFVATKPLNDVVKNFLKDIDSFEAIDSLYAMSIRDIDKIDILKQYLLSDYFLKKDENSVTKKVADDFLMNKLIRKEDRKTYNDVMILRLSFINDMNLTESLKMIKKENLLDYIYDVYLNKEQLSYYFGYAKERLDELIENNNGNVYVLKK